MSNARDELLRRVRAALPDVPPDEQPADVAVASTYQRTDDTPRDEQIDRFIERTEDYKAIVHTIRRSELAARIAQSCQERAITSLVVAPDLPKTWLSRLAKTSIEILRDDGLSRDDLERSGGVLTGCALAIAQTGTIVLDGGAYQGRRIITLLPDYHLCVVSVTQIVGIVPEAIASLGAMVRNEARPITFISGPSATSDIELNRVEGVHGPRTLEVLVVRP